MQNEFQEFIAACEDLGIGLDINEMSGSDKYKVGTVWNNVKEFLTSYNFVTPDKVGSLENIAEPTSLLNNTVSLVEIGPKAIEDLVESCKISRDYVAPAVEAVALSLTKYCSSNIIAEHFGGKDVSVEAVGNMSFKKLNSIYSDGQLANLYPSVNASMESFGARIDNTLIDAKIAISITILKFHKSIMPRLLPNRPTTSNVVMYEVDRFEVYDLTNAGKDTAQERYKAADRIPFIDLYRDPSPANMSSKPVIVKEANDTVDDFVLQDEYLYTGKTANLFDLSMDAGVIGYDHVDYTDLISEGGKLENLVLEITRAADSEVELIPIAVAERPGSRFVMSPNASDAADRFCALDFVTTLANDAALLAGTVSDIMDDFDPNHVIKLELNSQGKLNLRTSYMNVLGSNSASIITLDGTPVLAPMETLFDDLTFKIVAYKPKATFSEENIRKTTKAMRVLTKPHGYEIPGTTNVIVQHSLIQPRPEKTINALSNLMRVGNDDRGVTIILDAINNVYNRLQQEAVTPDMPYDQKAMNDFVAGHKSLPYIYMDTIDIGAEVANMRSAEALGDVRGLAEKKLLEVMTMLFNNSFYVQALDPGDRPVFKVLTSGYILDALLNVPYYHSALDQSPAEKAGNDTVEYRRMLPNGTELQIITTNFESFTDKILMVPSLPGKPNSELNFGQLIDKGSLVVSITPIVNNAGFKEIIANSREFALTTNPLCAYLTINNLSAIFNGMGGL